MSQLKADVIVGPTRSEAAGTASPMPGAGAVSKPATASAAALSTASAAALSKAATSGAAAAAEEEEERLEKLRWEGVMRNSCGRLTSSEMHALADLRRSHAAIHTPSLECTPSPTS